MYSNWLSKMFGTSLKALKAKHLCKKLNFSQNSTFSSKFDEKVKIPHLTEALQASKCYGVTSDTRLSFWSDPWMHALVQIHFRMLWIRFRSLQANGWTSIEMELHLVSNMLHFTKEFSCKNEVSTCRKKIFWPKFFFSKNHF